MPTKRISWASNPWWSKELEQIHLELLHRQRKWNRTKDRADRREVNACRWHLRRAIAEAKQASWRRICEDASDEDLWATFQKLMRPRHVNRIGDLRMWETLGFQMRQVRPGLWQTDSSPTPPCQASPPMRLCVHEWLRSSPVLEPLRFLTCLGQSCMPPFGLPAHGRPQEPVDVTNVCLRECEDILTPYLLPSSPLHCACKAFCLSGSPHWWWPSRSLEVTFLCLRDTGPSTFFLAFLRYLSGSSLFDSPTSLRHRLLCPRPSLDCAGLAEWTWLCGIS